VADIDIEIGFVMREKLEMPSSTLLLFERGQEELQGLKWLFMPFDILALRFWRANQKRDH